MNTKLLGTALIAASSAITGCGVLETIDVPEFRFDSNSYIVQPGDTLGSVASRYKVDPDSLISVNSLQIAELIPGQRLVLLRDDELVSMAAMANSRSTGGQVIQNTGVGVQASGVGQTVMMPNAIQTVSTVKPRAIGADVIATDIVAGVPTEEIISVVPAGAVAATDALLDDDQPVFLPEAGIVNSTGDTVVSAVDRPEGEETIIQSVNADGTVDMNQRLEIPNAGSIDIVDANPKAAAQRVTVNQRADGWNWPAIGMITREFDLREINRQGLDIDPGPGAGVQAAADGEVVYSGRDLASYGNLVILRHDNNYLSAYSKVSDIFVKENQKVSAGDLIASVGGDEAGGNELHFEIRRNGEPVNPIDYLPAL